MVLLILGLGAFLSLAMAGAWMIARRPGLSGWTDAIWSFALGVGAVAGALAPIDGAPGGRNWMVAALAGFWSLRLGSHIAARTRRHGEDPRYNDLRQQWGAAFDKRLFQFLQIQAMAAWLLVLSVMAAARNPASFPAWSDWAGAGLLLVAVLGEGAADRQLASFKASGAKGVCDVGLWGWSRHPNYFFEWLGWAGHAVIAIGPMGGWPWGWAALSGPAFMYWLLVKASGIPPLEAHMLRSRGDAYRAYQARVSAFWPWPPRDKTHENKSYGKGLD